jgi:hypothetical protein
MYQVARSNSPSPTTVNPITAPEENASLNPLFKLVRQALAVRALERVAMVIPQYPASAENIPPVKNAKGTNSVR